MKFSKEAFINSKIIQYILRVSNSNAVFKIIGIMIIWAIVLIPFYVYLLLRWITNAEGFWEELAVFLVCGITIGWAQVITVFFGIVLSFKLIFEDF